MADRIRIILADDHPMMRKGLRASLDSLPGIAIVGEAQEGKSALALIRDLKPQVAVLDIAMPLMDGFAILKEIKRLHLDVEVVFLTAIYDEEIFEEALAQGVKGYVLKESSAEEIIAGIRAVAEGRHYTSPAVTSYLVKRKSDSLQTIGGLSQLTPTEMRILRLIAAYKTTREIATELFISELTVQTHRRNICEKLGVSGSNALVKFALRNKLVLNAES